MILRCFDASRAAEVIILAPEHTIDVQKAVTCAHDTGKESGYTQMQQKDDTHNRPTINEHAEKECGCGAEGRPGDTGTTV